MPCTRQLLGGLVEMDDILLEAALMPLLAPEDGLALAPRQRHEFMPGDL